MSSTLNSQAATYDVDRTIGAGTVTGHIETDGTIGALANSNILDWAFTLTAPGLDGGSPDSIAMPAGAFNISSGLSATATELLFDFSMAGFTYFQESRGLTANGWCLAGPAGCGSVGGPNGEAVFWTFGQTDPAATVAQTGVLSVAAVVSPVPVPASLLLLIAALGGVALLRSDRR